MTPSGPERPAGSDAASQGEPPPTGRRGEDGGQLSGMARGGGLNLVGALFNQSALFAITALLAIPLGKTDVGRYATSYALLSILGLLSLVGFRAAMTRFVAVHLADEDWARVRGTIRLGLLMSLGSSLVFGAVVVAAAGWIAGVYDDPELRVPLILTGCTLPAATLADAALAATQGWRTQRPFTYIGRILDPGLRLVLTGGLLLAGAGLVGAMVALLVASWVAALAAMWALWRLVRRVPDARPVYAVRDIFSFSMVSWVSALASTGLIWADTLILGYFRSAGEVGIYNVSTRIVTLAVFVMAPINAAFAPVFAHAYHVGDHDEMSRTYSAATGWIVRLAMPAFVVLVVFPRDILRIFGEEFVVGAIATVILAVGQLVNASTGPVGSVLNMSRHVRLNMMDNIAALALNLVLNVVLVPRYGFVGSAVAWSVSLAGVNIARVLQARHYLGIRPFGRSTLKSLLAGLGAGLVALGVRYVVDGWLAELVVGAALGAVAFLGAVLALGLSADDRTVLAAVTRRRGVRPA